jgi:hypothetical protein
MSKWFIKTNKGNRAVVDTESDLVLFRRDGKYDGSELLFHKTKKDEKVFYLYHWSNWEGVGDGVNVLDSDGVYEVLNGREISDKIQDLINTGLLNEDDV